MSSIQQTGRFHPFGNSNIQRKQISAQGLVLFIKKFNFF